MRGGETGIPTERPVQGYVRALDGIRGIAVILVLLFHLEVTGFAAGFLGVDLFFVLSGFLITSLLLTDIERHGHVSLARFWERRVRRLAPALVLVLLTVAAVTWLTASPIERESVRGDLLASSAYVANWRLISTSSYFESNGVESPVQHFWSLAIEEQFYLVWPVVIAGALLLVRRRRLAVAIPAVLVGSVSVVLLASLWRAAAPERAYEGTDARVFEPLIGALGAVIMTTDLGRRIVRKAGTPLAVASIAGLAVALTMIRPGGWLYFHGGALVVSVLALGLVAPIWVGAGGFIRRGFEWRPLVWIGAISYGIYLWHWPIILWLGARGEEGWSRVASAVLVVVATLVVSMLSYRLVEQPIRSGRRPGGQHRHSVVWERRLVLASVPVALVAVACVSIAATVVPPIDERTPVIMLTGDSVPQHLEVALEEAAMDRGWRLVSAAFGGCPVSGERPTNAIGRLVPAGSGCPDKVRAAQDALIDRVDPEVIVWWDRWSLSSFVGEDGEVIRSGTPAFWRQRSRTLDASVRRVTRDGARVLFIATEPPGTGMADGCEDRCPGWHRFLLAHYDDTTTRWNRMLASYARSSPGRSLFRSVTNAVCHTDVSPCDDTIEGEPARPDGTHYEGAGQDVVVALLMGYLNSF